MAPLFSDRGRFLILGSFLVLCLGLSATAKPSLHWVTKGDNPVQATVEVRGLPVDWKLPDDPAKQRSLLSVRVATAPPNAPAMAGSSALADGILTFRPRFPLTPGLRYHAVFQQSDPPLTRTFTVPIPAPKEATIISNITPSASRLPLNLLKFYIHFSAPMTRGHAYEYIRLLDDSGNPVEDPFLELPEELWNKEMTRLTILFDPGRIKRGLLPNETVGAVMEAGKRYSLFIDGRWKDASRQSLGKPTRKTFLVTAADYQQPSIKEWKKTIPPPGTREPLSLRFGEPLDAALATRLLTIRSLAGKLVPGKVSLSAHEETWSFTPDQPWAPLEYKLHIDHRLEDLAGNSIARKFEENLDRLPDKVGEGPQRSRLSFTPKQK